MGLSVSPAIWQYFIQRVLQGIPNYRKNHLAIMDDILTLSKIIDYTGHLIDLFKAVIRNGLKISQRKCKLFKKALVFMGITIMIETSKVKNRCYSESETTKDYKRMQIFLWYGKLHVNLYT